jgi:hypothetical protein
LLRLSVVAGALLFLVWEAAGSFAQVNAHSAADSARLLVVFPICALLIFSILLTSSVRWTIRRNEIQIERKRIIGRPRVEVVKRDDIFEITILKEGTETGPRVWLLLHCFSGPSVESPAVQNGAQADELRTEIARRLRIMASIKQI